MTTRPTIRSLDDLHAVLHGAPTEKDSAAQAEYAVRHGLPVAHGAIDWTDLPTFGGAAPATTVGVWSWDVTRLLVGDPDDLRVVPRE